MLLGNIGRKTGGRFAWHRPHMAMCQNDFHSAVLHGVVTEPQNSSRTISVNTATCKLHPLPEILWMSLRRSNFTQLQTVSYEPSNVRSTRSFSLAVDVTANNQTLSINLITTNKPRNGAKKAHTHKRTHTLLYLVEQRSLKQYLEDVKSVFVNRLTKIARSASKLLDLLQNSSKNTRTSCETIITRNYLFVCSSKEMDNGMKIWGIKRQKEVAKQKETTLDYHEKLLTWRHLSGDIRLFDHHKQMPSACPALNPTHNNIYVLAMVYIRVHVWWAVFVQFILLHCASYPQHWLCPFRQPI